MALKLITAPTAEPITVDEAKAHLRVFGADDDAYIGSLIVAARQSAENLTGRALMAQTWDLALDEFPCIGCQVVGDRNQRHVADVITLPKPPAVSIESIKYVDTAGAQQTLAEALYVLDDFSEPARLIPVYGASWPATRCQPNAVVIRFRAGYENAAAVPQEIKQWMLLRIGMLYENRESVAAGVTLAELPHVDRLLDAYRIWGA